MKKLSMRDRVRIWNQTYKGKYPKMMFDRKWLYGVWYCGTDYRKSKYYGQYPPHYLTRLMTLFPDKKVIVHVCSGVVEKDITVDIKKELRPVVCADVQHLPFRPNTVDLFIADPPYSKKHAEEDYGTPYPTMYKTMKSALPILKVGGYFIILDIRYPSYRRKDGWGLVGLIMVVTGFAKVFRGVSIFEKEF